MSSCARHPSAPAARRCSVCSQAFCKDCIAPTLDASASEGYGVCDECRPKVAPHVWNRFGAGLPDEGGAHITDGLFRPRLGLLRAAFGEVPWGGLAATTFLGSLGAAWVILQGQQPEMPGGVRFGSGFLHVWETGGVALVFALSMHALQPIGPGESSPLRRSLGIVATAWLPASIVALGAGLLGFAMPLLLPGLSWGTVGGGLIGVAAAWGILLSGQGLALRRGASKPVGVGASIVSLVVSLLVLALVTWIRLNPPWGDAWDAAGG